MLRLGRVYKDPKAVREMSEERDETAEAIGSGESGTTKDAGMAELLRLLMEDRRARERARSKCR